VSGLQIKLYRARLSAIVKGLESASQTAKQGHIALSTADDFNSLLTEIASAHPELEKSLPQKIPREGMLARHGVAPLSFLDLQLKCNQVISLLDVLDSET
jgi:hypothetical protein